MRHGLLIAIAVSALAACSGERTSASGEPRVNEGKPSSNMNNVKPPVEPEPSARSQFTSIDPASCKLLEENIEEGGWSRRLCDGLAGYKLELTDSDLRQDIIVIPANGQRSELGLTEIVADQIGSSGFSRRDLREAVRRCLADLHPAVRA